MSFEDIPEDKERSFPCPSCHDGVVVLSEGVWGCSTCGWNAADEASHVAPGL